MRSTIAAFLLSASLPAALDAQIFLSHSANRSTGGGWSFDVGGQMARPVGEFGANVKHAWGGAFAARYHFPRVPVLGVRGDIGFLNYGHERKRVMLSSTINRVLVDQTTTNNIALITIGPELALQSGPLRPYVYGFGGWSHFYTESSASDDRSGQSFASSVNFSDGGGTGGWGGGLRIPFRARSVDVSLDGGARFTRNWTRSYLRPGDITDQPDGSLVFNERRTAADFWQFHLGASFTPRRRSR